MGEVQFQEILVDVEAHLVGIVFVLVVLGGIVVMVVSHGSSQAEVVVEQVYPLQRGVGIGIIVLLVLDEVEAVVAVVAAQVEIVLLAELVREHDVGIPEACLTVLVAALFGQQSQHPVAISGTSAQQEGGLVLLDRAFQCHTAGEET